MQGESVVHSQGSPTSFCFLPNPLHLSLNSPPFLPLSLPAVEQTRKERCPQDQQFSLCLVLIIIPAPRGSLGCWMSHFSI